jgi:Polypeptide deformylase
MPIRHDCCGGLHLTFILPCKAAIRLSYSRTTHFRGLCTREYRREKEEVDLRLKIVQAGEPVLRQTARPLTHQEILGDEIQRLIGDMKETMQDAPGVGLAAPQVGLPLQLAVIEDREELLKGLPPQEVAEIKCRSWQRTTVSGVTRMRACCHPDKNRRTAT